MTAIHPIAFTWDGDHMVPLSPAAADRQYVVHETYRLVPYEDRSQASHNQYFAAVNEAWQNLPAEVAERFATAEHLRKLCLIKAGYRDERSIVAASKAEAQRLVAFIRPLDDYAVVLASEAVVTVYTAKSQSMKAMGKRVFQESKQAVLDICADLIGVAPAQLSSNAGRAA
jgi:hypothetical protein